ncbi:hypothetical protein [Thermomonas sp. HDW16]|uniref:hypothetical protein n=1 Tax=Thermomonas sp. HDW16 TaxID=2714945 RepID=UPI00140E78E2|nr:hypothetical protein [Thermomonas sp. HDW16]QIL20322.1 hypothetical protein G7079_05955 [Thermomonas sp. HDW16]
MKLQLDGDLLRLRISEEELAQLGEDGELQQRWPCPNRSEAHCTLELHDDASQGRCEGDLMALRVVLSRNDFLAFADERPRRDGFSFAQKMIRVSVEVDVRDSHRQRKQAAQAMPD